MRLLRALLAAALIVVATGHCGADGLQRIIVTASLDYTPTVTCSNATSLGAYTAAASSQVVQKIVTTMVSVSISSLGSCTGPLVVSLYPGHQLQSKPALNGLSLGVGQDGNTGNPVTFFAQAGAGMEFQTTIAAHTYNGTVTYGIQ